MHSRPTERWTVEALARAAGLSRAAFARRFLAELGVPPLRHLTDLRMRRAARRLVESDDSLAAIAADVGYDSEFAFGRAFKRHLGEAPGAYRRRVRAEVALCGAPLVLAAA
ncbi:MAG: helix-turn-helix transcriptional regulator [Nannocystaceae bacterium]